MFRKLMAATAFAALPLSASAGSILVDGDVVIGVKDTGALNFGSYASLPAGTLPASPLGTSLVGLRHKTTGNEATSHGCVCEGWGVGIADAGGAAVASGWDANGFSNLTVDSFVTDWSGPGTADGTTATSVTSLTSGELKITHDFALSSSDQLYKVAVTIENTSGVDIADLRYTRLMDWDIDPTAFSEYSTIDGTTEATAVLYANNDGFDVGNPFAFRSPLGGAGGEGDFDDFGPRDHGALFDFGFGALAAGESFVFDIFYGAAGTEREALAALSAVEAEVFSLGQSSCDPDGLGLACSGDPSSTFIFGFKGVGGIIVPPPPDGVVPVPAAAWLLIGGLGLLGGLKRRKKAA